MILSNCGLSCTSIGGKTPYPLAYAPGVHPVTDCPTCFRNTLIPFDNSIGSRVTGVVGFLPANLLLLKPFCSRLRVWHGTDRRTDRQTTVINALWEVGHKTFQTMYIPSNVTPILLVLSIFLTLSLIGERESGKITPGHFLCMLFSNP